MEIVTTLISSPLILGSSVHFSFPMCYIVVIHFFSIRTFETTQIEVWQYICLCFKHKKNCNYVVFQGFCLASSSIVPIFFRFNPLFRPFVISIISTFIFVLFNHNFLFCCIVICYLFYVLIIAILTNMIDQHRNIHLIEFQRFLFRRVMLGVTTI